MMTTSAVGSREMYALTTSSFSQVDGNILPIEFGCSGYGADYSIKLSVLSYWSLMMIDCIDTDKERTFLASVIR